MSHMFKRSKSHSTLWDDADTIRSNVTTGSSELPFPRDLKSVTKAVHVTRPLRLPQVDASQDEVRYFLYTLLTHKELGLYKNGPQWILETVMSWRGDGSVLRDMSVVELEMLCPMKAGHAALDPSKNKLEIMAPIRIRNQIGHTISTIVKSKLAKEQLPRKVRDGWEANMNLPSLNRSRATVPEPASTPQWQRSAQDYSLGQIASGCSSSIRSPVSQAHWDSGTYHAVSLPDQMMTSPCQFTTASLYENGSPGVTHSTPALSSVVSIRSMNASQGSTIGASPRSTSTLQTSPPGSEDEFSPNSKHAQPQSRGALLPLDSIRPPVTAMTSSDLNENHKGPGRYRAQSFDLPQDPRQHNTRYTQPRRSSNLRYEFQNMAEEPQRPNYPKYNTTGHIYQTIGGDGSSTFSSPRLVPSYESPHSSRFARVSAQQQSFQLQGDTNSGSEVQGLASQNFQKPGRQRQSQRHDSAIIDDSLDSRRFSSNKTNQQFYRREPQQSTQAHTLASRQGHAGSGYKLPQASQPSPQVDHQISQRMQASCWSADTQVKTNTLKTQDSCDTMTNRNTPSTSEAAQTARKAASNTSMNTVVSADSVVTIRSAEKRSIAKRLTERFHWRERSRVPQVATYTSPSRPVNSCKADANTLEQADFIRFKARTSQARTDVVEREMARNGLIKNANAYASEPALYERAKMHSMMPERRSNLRDSLRPLIRYVDPITGQPRHTLVETIEEKEFLDGKTQRGLDNTDWKGHHSS
ncbi:hypothetical protein P153DRAFT_409508 [Dothidotthia symphoricarpi CBS 119687]|uniref:Uncharacterized protein n=1 Tax=Dothidotthia symphoricarpi CBS 119687 TaxID=1392245 RepID=A0A6A6ASC0_9PLEO|nr:uncharacterized protein P153DRAFT_409508 [Dothidotthia symphoricarpi CBS 119687]KAF2134103.1 hypothetical protein P153DRAFT_409508 [Dothidotthia symphoricarpi CBS 119687]